MRISDSISTTHTFVVFIVARLATESLLIVMDFAGIALSVIIFMPHVIDM